MSGGNGKKGGKLGWKTLLESKGYYERNTLTKGRKSYHTKERNQVVTGTKVGTVGRPGHVRCTQQTVSTKVKTTNVTIDNSTGGGGSQRKVEIQMFSLN